MNIKQLAAAGGVAVATGAAAVSTGITPAPELTAAVGTVAGVTTLLLVIRRARAITDMMDSPGFAQKLSSVNKRQDSAH